jgi:hypothetical protein
MKLTKHQLTGILKEAIQIAALKNPKVMKSLAETPGQIAHEPSTGDGNFGLGAVNKLQGAREFVDGASLFIKFIANFKDEQATLSNLKDAMTTAAIGLGIEETVAVKYAAKLTMIFQAMEAEAAKAGREPAQAEPAPDAQPQQGAVGMRSY